jgi:hypothetical protein
LLAIVCLERRELDARRFVGLYLKLNPSAASQVAIESVRSTRPAARPWYRWARRPVLGQPPEEPHAQRFSPTDKRAFMMIGRQEFQPILDGLTIGLQGLLLFIGTLTLTIGGVGAHRGRAAPAHILPIRRRRPSGKALGRALRKAFVGALEIRTESRR